jgi:hypothetical protein
MNSPKHADEDESENDLDVSDDGVSNNGTFGDSDSTDSDPHCDGCERQFIDITALNQHLFNSLKHNWCFDCSRDFGSKDSLLQVSHITKLRFLSLIQVIYSTKTPSPIADVILNALSAAGQLRIRLRSPHISNPDAARSPTSLAVRSVRPSSS